MEDYSAIKNNDIMNFTAKCLQLENVILSYPNLKGYDWYILTYNYYHKVQDNHAIINRPKDAK
jgi:chlorite dismutase